MPATCQSVIHGRRSRGVMSRGTESFVTSVRICGRPVEDGHLCPKHEAEAAALAAVLTARRGPA